MAWTLQNLVFINQSDSEKGKKTRETFEDFLIFTYIHKALPGKKATRDFPFPPKQIYPTILGSPDFDTS